jgi:hypothetical protein
MQVDLRVTDLPVFREWLETVRDFINEYAWHTRECASIDADGEWRRGNPSCTCGYDEALTTIQQGVSTESSQQQRAVDSAEYEERDREVR